MDVSLLLVSGSLRAGSTNSAVVRTASTLVPAGASAQVYEGLRSLPHFDPDDDRNPLAPPVRRLREAVRRADAVVFSTPEYAGALPGALTNLLDWLIGDDDERSIHATPVGWVNASAAPTGAADAHASLRVILGYAHARCVEAACRSVPVPRAAVGADGLIADPIVRRGIADVLTALIEDVAAGG